MVTDWQLPVSKQVFILDLYNSMIHEEVLANHVWTSQIIVAIEKTLFVHHDSLMPKVRCNKDDRLYAWGNQDEANGYTSHPIALQS